MIPSKRRRAIDDQAHIGPPIELRQIVPPAEQPLLPEENLARQRVQEFPFGQGVVDAPAVVFVTEVVECCDRFEHAPQSTT
jgi:hypothetical protein